MGGMTGNSTLKLLYHVGLNDSECVSEQACQRVTNSDLRCLKALDSLKGHFASLKLVSMLRPQRVL